MKEKKSFNIKWKLEFLENELECSKQILEDEPSLDDINREFVEEEVSNLKKWIQELKIEQKKLSKKGDIKK